MQYLGVTDKHLEINENINEYRNKELLKKLKTEDIHENIISKKEQVDQIQEESVNKNELTEKDLEFDFCTSSAISRVNIKFLLVYVPIFWISGLAISIFLHWFFLGEHWTEIIIFLPFFIFGSIYFFIFACMLFSKLLLILINLIHRPREGVFKAELGDKDFEFWALRTELKKISLWFMRNSPFPWLDVLVFKLFGVKMDFSSHLNDAWCDGEFIEFGRKNLIGQGSLIMSSIVIGKYLIIKKVIFGDYVMVGGHSSVLPGSIVGKEAFIGAVSTTHLNQILEPGWIYSGIPVMKLKPKACNSSLTEYKLLICSCIILQQLREPMKIIFPEVQLITAAQRLRLLNTQLQAALQLL